MPRRANISHPALRAIAEDQRYAPKDAALRAVERIETLASEIDAGASYPHDYIVFRITGYRPAEGGIELIGGAALLENLSALGETLASNAALEASSLPPSSLSIDEMCERWSVSRRSVDRDRRRGLIARRVRTDDGNERLAFAPRVYEAFERAHPSRDPDATPMPKRLTDDEAALILKRAERYEASLGMSKAEIVGRLAARLRRSPGAVRKVLDDTEGAEQRTQIDDRARRLLLGGWERGVPIEQLARYAQRSRSATHRAILRERLARLNELESPAPAERAAGEGEALSEPVARTGLLIGAPSDVEGVRALASAMALVPRSEERVLALASRAAWRRATSLARTVEAHAPPARLVDRAETDVRWAGLLRERLAWLELPLVVRTIEERSGSSLGDIRERLAMRLVAGGMRLVAEAVAGFDASRGGRLAGRVSLSLDRYVVAQIALERERRATGSATKREIITHGAWRSVTRLGGSQFEAPGWLLSAIGLIGADSRRLIEQRYGLAGERPRTVGELAAECSVGVRAMWGTLHRAVREARAVRA